MDTLFCWVVLTQLWVKYGQTQPLGYIFYLHFYPNVWVCPYKVGLKQPSIFRV